MSTIHNRPPPPHKTPTMISDAAQSSEVPDEVQSPDKVQEEKEEEPRRRPLRRRFRSTPWEQIPAEESQEEEEEEGGDDCCDPERQVRDNDGVRIEVGLRIFAHGITH